MEGKLIIIKSCVNWDFGTYQILEGNNEATFLGNYLVFFFPFS